jgi:hypothetical protein
LVMEPRKNKMSKLCLTSQLGYEKCQLYAGCS